MSCKKESSWKKWRLLLQWKNTVVIVSVVHSIDEKIAIYFSMLCHSNINSWIKWYHAQLSFSFSFLFLKHIHEITHIKCVKVWGDDSSVGGSLGLAHVFEVLMFCKDIFYVDIFFFSLISSIYTYLYRSYYTYKKVCMVWFRTPRFTDWRFLLLW